MQKTNFTCFRLAFLTGLLSLFNMMPAKSMETSRTTAIMNKAIITPGGDLVIPHSRDTLETMPKAAVPCSDVKDDHLIGVIELRNYVMKHGMRDPFIRFFEKNFIESQDTLQGYVLGRYRVADKDDNFCWIRGFENMHVRGTFLPSFYHGAVWKKNRIAANGMLANNDNVYLLKPMVLQDDSLVPARSVSPQTLSPQKGITVVQFYIANSKLPHLLKLFSKNYLDRMKESGFARFSVWTSEMQQNDFPQLPVFQDKNLLAVISFFNNEAEYSGALRKLESGLPPDLKADFDDTITIKNTWILHPTEKSLVK